MLVFTLIYQTHFTSANMTRFKCLYMLATSNEKQKKSHIILYVWTVAYVSPLTINYIDFLVLFVTSS
jgi:hypothetical protein